MKCELHSYMVPDGPPFFAGGTTHAITECKTHHWRFDGPASLSCPIGRIEEAADLAIRRIREAKQDAVGDPI